MMLQSQERKSELKRGRDCEEGNDGEREEIGPLPAEITKPSRKKRGNLIFIVRKSRRSRSCMFLENQYFFSTALAYEQVYLDSLPSAEMYERSYMHRDIITQIVCTRSSSSSYLHVLYVPSVPFVVLCTAGLTSWSRLVRMAMLSSGRSKSRG